ncbi:MAG: nickel pincer cofactor biosynthesis protein LarC [Leptolyngbya sp.]|nr:nickel pincer cofactor biosynthesis protein LarC [Leptolyngbya sp.]
MKTIAYLDCPSGISGDMCLGAILDAGVPLDYLITQLDRLGLGDEFQLSATPVQRQGLRALKAHVDLTAQGHTAQGHATQNHRAAHEHHHSHGHHHSHEPHHGHESHEPHGPSSTDDHPAPAPAHASRCDGADPHAHGSRHLPEIETLILRADLPERACQWSLAVFRQLAAAEAAVHGIAIDQVHFHEVGATDALVDIVGTCLGLDYLGIDEVYCSALPTGQGRVKAAHGWLPVPAPAVLKLMELRQMPIYPNDVWGEQVTPTGAALVAALAQGFGSPPAMTLQRVGLGAGQKDFPQANILRLWVGTVGHSPAPSPAPNPRRGEVSSPADPTPNPRRGEVSSPADPPTTPGDITTETLAVLETQVDDMVPQAMGYLYDRLFEAGAVDVFAQTIAMKKSRPGLLITVLCPIPAETRCTEVLFAETPTLGIRHRHQSRRILKRDFQTIATPYGPVALKVAYHPQTQAVLNVHPEYEDCAALARQHGVPWQVVYHTALGGWYQGGEPAGAMDPEGGLSPQQTD